MGNDEEWIRAIHHLALSTLVQFTYMRWTCEVDAVIL